MIRLPTLAAIAVLSLGTVACGGSKPDSSSDDLATNVDESVSGDMNAGADMDANVAAATSGALAPADFAAAAAASDLFVVETSKLARDQGGSAAVKSYAAMMIAEHGKSTAKLKSVAGEVNPVLSLPTALSADNQAKVDSLKALSGAEFDRRYLADQKAGHEDTLAKMRAFAVGGPAGSLKDFATTGTAMVEQHLAELGKVS